MRVLVVEDSLVNQRLLTALLERRDCAVTLANNGQQAVENVVEEDFDVVLMDVQMPVMDGLTATRLIREREQAGEKHTPIVAVTDGVDRELCLEAGMDDYLAKPVEAEPLSAILDGVLGHSA